MMGNTRRHSPDSHGPDTKDLIIIGGRGNGTVVASTVEDLNAVRPSWNIRGFLDDRDEGPINGYPVLGPIDAAVVQQLLRDPNVHFFWSLVSTRLRRGFVHRLHDLQIPRERFATVIHPTAVVSQSALIGRGVAIQPFVNVGPNARLGDHIHVFAQAMIGHDAILEDFAYVANNACIGAHVSLREGAYVGTNATTLESIELGPWSLVGMGSVVIESVPESTKVVGNPARTIGRSE